MEALRTHGRLVKHYVNTSEIAGQFSWLRHQSWNVKLRRRELGWVVQFGQLVKVHNTLFIATCYLPLTADLFKSVQYVLVGAVA